MSSKHGYDFSDVDPYTRVRKRQRTDSTSTSPPETPTTTVSALHMLPAELTQIIATMVASYGLSNLLSLMLTCRRLYGQLSTPGAQGAVFENFFDTSAPGRRILQHNGPLREYVAQELAKLPHRANEEPWCGGITSAGCASQLPVYALVLKLLSDNLSVYDEEARTVLSTSFIMLLEDDSFDPEMAHPSTTGPKFRYGNGMRLRDAGLGKWVLKWIRARLWEDKSTDGWPQPTDISTLAVWVLWLTLDEETLQNFTEAERKEITTLLFPFVGMPIRYPNALAAPNHRHLPLTSTPKAQTIMTVRTAHGPYPLYLTVVPWSTSSVNDSDQPQRAIDNDDLPVPGSARSRAVLEQGCISIESDRSGLVINKSITGTGGENIDYHRVCDTLQAAGFFADKDSLRDMQVRYPDLFRKGIRSNRKPTDAFSSYFSNHFVAPLSDVPAIDDILAQPWGAGDISYVAGLIAIPAKLAYVACLETQKFGIPPHLAETRLDRAIRAINRAEEDGEYEGTFYDPDDLRKLVLETGTITHQVKPAAPCGSTKGQILWGEHHIDLGPGNKYDNGPTKEDLEEFSSWRAAKLVSMYSKMKSVNPSWSSSEKLPPRATSVAGSGASKPRYTLAPHPNDGYDYNASERFDHDFIRLTELVDISQERTGQVGQTFGEGLEIPGDALDFFPQKTRGHFDLPLGAWGALEDTLGRKHRRTCYTLGSLTGTWQGRQLVPAHGRYFESLAADTMPPGFSDSYFHMQSMPVFMRLQEHVSCGEYHKSEDEDTLATPTSTETGIIDDGINNGWFPNGTRAEFGTDSLTIHPPVGTPSTNGQASQVHQPSRYFFAEHGPRSPNAKTYETYVPGQPLKSLTNAVKNHNPEICPACVERRARKLPAEYESDFSSVGLNDAAPGINEIIVTGSMDERHAQAWGARRIYGRIRHWDGLIGLMRVPLEGSPEFLYGYIICGQTFQGTWRVANTRTDLPPWEGPFVLSRRDD